VLTITEMNRLSHKMSTLQEVMNGRLSQLVALTAVSSEAIGVEKGRLAEIARVISDTLPMQEPLLSTLSHFQKTNGEELVIPIPVPTPTVVLVPTEDEKQAAEMAARQIEELHRRIEQKKENGNG